MSKVKSPCIDLCQIDLRSGWCRGCLRTRDEIKRWKDLKKKKRFKVLRALPIRRRLAAAFEDKPEAAD
jgi:predicted Fe-S protein YdhL (DUF1289 family)